MGRLKIWLKKLMGRPLVEKDYHDDVEAEPFHIEELECKRCGERFTHMDDVPTMEDGYCCGHMKEKR
jgi:hypothetical protein